MWPNQLSQAVRTAQCKVVGERHNRKRYHVLKAQKNSLLYFDEGDGSGLY